LRAGTHSSLLERLLLELLERERPELCEALARLDEEALESPFCPSSCCWRFVNPFLS